MFLSSFFTFVKVATELFNPAMATRHLDKTFLAVRLKKIIFCSRGVKGIPENVYSLCILRCVRKKNVHRLLYFKHGALYRIWKTDNTRSFLISSRHHVVPYSSSLILTSVTL